MAEQTELTLEDAINKINELTHVVTEQDKRIGELGTQYQGLIAFINEFSQNTNGTLKVLDNLTFVATMMWHSEGKEFALSPETINSTRGAINGVAKTFDEYRNKLNEEAERQEKEETKAAEKKAKVVAARNKRKGKVVEDAEAN